MNEEMERCSHCKDGVPIIVVNKEVINARYCPMCSRDLNNKRKYQNGVYNYITESNLKQGSCLSSKYISVLQCRIYSWSEKSDKYSVNIRTGGTLCKNEVFFIKSIYEHEIITDEELDKLEESGVHVNISAIL